MLRHRIGHTSMSRYAWMAPALVLLAVVVIFLFGNDSEKQTEMLEVTRDYERVRLESPTSYGDLQSFAPLSDAKQQTALQRLSALRAEFRVVSPAITVTGLEGSSDANGLAQRIGTLLAQSSLGRHASDAESTELVDSTPGSEQDNVIIFARVEDKAIAHGLLAALSPMLSGTVNIQFDDARRPGDMLLVVVATPKFTAEGVAVFPQER